MENERRVWIYAAAALLAGSILSTATHDMALAREELQAEEPESIPDVSQQRPGPAGPEDGAMRQQLWLLPTTDGSGRLMRATVYRPKGAGPFPLAIVNHGTSGEAKERAKAPVPTFPLAARFLVTRGYAVAMPQRRGLGQTGGRLDEGGSCDNPDYARNGRESARDIAAAVTYLRQQPFVKPDRLVVMGQSTGGWASLAYGSLNPPGLSAVVNFAGGRGGHAGGVKGQNCRGEKLISAAGALGRTTRAPTLWVYTENDTYFGPELSKAMAQEFRNAGGNVEFHLLERFSQDGHFLFTSAQGVQIWEPILSDFFKKNGL